MIWLRFLDREAICCLSWENKRVLQKMVDWLWKTEGVFLTPGGSEPCLLNRRWLIRFGNQPTPSSKEEQGGHSMASVTVVCLLCWCPLPPKSLLAPFTCREKMGQWVPWQCQPGGLWHLCEVGRRGLQKKKVCASWRNLPPCPLLSRSSTGNTQHGSVTFVSMKLGVPNFLHCCYNSPQRVSKWTWRSSSWALPRPPQPLLKLQYRLEPTVGPLLWRTYFLGKGRPEDCYVWRKYCFSLQTFLLRERCFEEKLNSAY